MATWQAAVAEVDVRRVDAAVEDADVDRARAERPRVRLVGADHAHAPLLGLERVRGGRVAGRGSFLLRRLVRADGLDDGVAVEDGVLLQERREVGVRGLGDQHSDLPAEIVRDGAAGGLDRVDGVVVGDRVDRVARADGVALVDGVVALQRDHVTLGLDRIVVAGDRAARRAREPEREADQQERQQSAGGAMHELPPRPGRCGDRC
jgi:hypothetical protein